MKNLAIVPAIFLLSGCQGDKSNTELKYTLSFHDSICFSTDKNDVLDYYRIEIYKGGSYRMFAQKEDVALSYPDTCIRPKLKKGYRYKLTYGLNGKNYYDSLFLNNDWKY
ncbi:putative T6SS immunity periplasmic lipoprotein [Enterobacteriaceae bacterium C34A]